MEKILKSGKVKKAIYFLIHQKLIPSNNPGINNPQSSS
jgi:hypothetical protein